ncbi:hypothetical protein HDU89_000893 [Geranomyces variabilis]|nr:hypothetical protein HDU89_000893 [Geranomyces variabilis]
MPSTDVFPLLPTTIPLSPPRSPIAVPTRRGRPLLPSALFLLALVLTAILALTAPKPPISVTSTASSPTVTATPTGLTLTFKPPLSENATAHVLVFGPAGWGHFHAAKSVTAGAWTVDWDFSPGVWILGVKVAAVETSHRVLVGGVRSPLPPFTRSFSSPLAPYTPGVPASLYPTGSTAANLTHANGLLTARVQQPLDHSHLFLVDWALETVFHVHSDREAGRSAGDVQEAKFAVPAGLESGQWWAILQGQQAGNNLYAVFMLYICSV